MISFADIPSVIKTITAVVAAIVGTFLWMNSNFETVAASEQKWDQHNQAITCRTVYELEERIRSYLDQMHLDPNMTLKDKAWIEAQIRYLNDKIKRIDPNGRCR